MDIYWGFQNLFCHQKYREDLIEKDEAGDLSHKSMAALRLFEELGEAIPQFAIAVTFYANNAHWLPEDELKFGIFTMVMSAGSTLMGIGGGFCKCYSVILDAT